MLLPSIGILNETIVPFCHSDLSPISPPSFSINFCQTVNPIPHPLGLIALSSETMLKSLNSLCWSFSLIPIPVSSTLNFINWESSCCSNLAEIRMLPWNVNLKEFEIRLNKTCFNLWTMIKIFNTVIILTNYEN